MNESSKDMDFQYPTYSIGETLEKWFKQDEKYHCFTMITEEEKATFFLDGVEVELVKKLI